ncbi:EAL domain-containing protein [Aeromonas sp. S41-2]|uniref:EAL domain-containing protein n=1 Tax=Aeromonas sp. S41-2 TaxID=2990502 RepID=UPI0022E31750|nr:EAL domain-containing protein [Aeromonas sp. S41-2]
MSGLIAELRDKGVDLQPYRLIGIEQIESFNAKRRSLFNPAIIHSLKPLVQELFTADFIRNNMDASLSGAAVADERLSELFYRPHDTQSAVAFYNSCDAISLVELTLLQLSDALLNALREESTALFFKVESRVLYALGDALIYFSEVFLDHGVRLHIEVSQYPFISSALPVSTLVKLHEHGVILVMDNFDWRGGDWRERYLSSGIFSCVKFDTPPLLQSEINVFKDALLSLQETFRMKTIVSKVETKRQSEVVLSTGCWAVQGFYYARPRSVNLMDLQSL